MIFTLRFYISLLISLYIATAASGADLYVSVEGNDKNPGTKDKPLLTLEGARDMIRAARKQKGLPKGGVTVYLRSGRYHVNKAFELGPGDSGTATAPIVYKAMPGEAVFFDGGKIIPSSACKTVSTKPDRNRLLPDARDKIMVIDLKALGLTDYGDVGPRGFGRSIIPAPVELFINGRPLEVSRWPNRGEKTIPLGKVLDPGSKKRDGDKRNLPATFEYNTARANRWTKAKDLHISGIFSWCWADDTIKVTKVDTKAGTFTTKDAHLYGFGNKEHAYGYWYAVNLIEEIDLPGEFCLETGPGKLYFYPPKGTDMNTACVQVSTMTDTFVQLKGASYVHIEGITFENSRGAGIRIENGTSNRISHCAIRQIGGLGIAANGGTKHAITSCNIYYTGAGGVSINGGDRKTLTPAGHLVENCDIHRVNRWYRTYCPCINVKGVGNTVRHNHLHHVPGQCILFGGNNHLFEFNEMDNAVSEMADMGAMYTGRNPSCLGHVIRHNFFHTMHNTMPGSPGVQAIFFDDNDLYTANIYGNVFYKTGNTGVIKFNGGGGASIHNNIAIECPKLVQGGEKKHVDRAIGAMHKDLKGHGIPAKVTKQVDIRKDPYKSRYPYLYDTYTKKFNYGTPAWNNLIIKPEDAKDPVDKTRNMISKDLSQFVNPGAMDFMLKPTSPMLKYVAKKVYDRVAEVDHKNVPFKPIPFDKIGLYGLVGPKSGPKLTGEEKR